MKDLQGHSTRTTTKTTNSYSNSNVDDSENMTQPPPQHPLFEHHQHHNHDHDHHHHNNNNNNQQHLNHLEREQEKSISDETMEGDLFDCALEQYSKQQPKRSKKANGNIINYCKNNNPHQSIKKPTDGTGSHKNNIITSYYDHQSHEDMDDNYPKEEVDYDDVDDVDVVKHDYHDDHHHHHHYENDSSNSIFDHHEHLQRQQQQQMQQTIKARPNVAASSPIQVPARRARKDFYSMKLNMLKVERDDDIQDESSTGLDAGNASTTDESTSSSTATQDSEDFSPVRRGDRNRPPIENMPAFDEDDAFLDREFNENHYNHYVLDGLDDEHLTAEEDPMRLFASIQALAKSLHEDAELFGSLPPKRLLESPIRSIAFV